MATDNASPLSGTITVYNNTATFTIIPIVDALTEGLEYITMGVTTATSDQVLASATVTIGDTGTPSVTSTPTTTSTPAPTNTSTPAPTNTPSSTLAPTYLLTANKTSMNEGDSVIFTITGSNIPNGTVVYWGSDYGLSPHNNTVTGSDFGLNDSSSLSQTAAVTAVTINNNTAQFTLTAANDLTTEGTETLALVIRGSQGGAVLATAPQVTVNDTSMVATALNTAPTNIGWPTANGTVGNAVDAQFASLFSDAQNNIVSYAATGLPPGLTINTSTGRVTGNTSQIGVFPSTVSAKDSGNLSSTMSGIWNIEPDVIVDSINNVGTFAHLQVTYTNGFTRSGPLLASTSNPVTSIINGWYTSTIGRQIDYVGALTFVHIYNAVNPTAARAAFDDAVTNSRVTAGSEFYNTSVSSVRSFCQQAVIGPAYYAQFSAGNVSESNTIVGKFQTANVPGNSTFGYKIYGFPTTPAAEAVNDADFAVASGTFTTNSSGSGVFTVTVVNDYISEPAELFYVDITLNGQSVAGTNVVGVNAN